MSSSNIFKKYEENKKSGDNQTSTSYIGSHSGERISRSSSRPSLFRRRSSSISFKKYHASDNEDDPLSNENVLMTVPHIESTLDASLPMKYFKKDVVSSIELLKVPHWYSRIHQKKNLDMKKLTLSKISGALTNLVFRVAYPKLPSLLLRIYGPNVENIIDREYELKILARLSLKEIGPKLYGCFSNGRFEEFLENSKTLNKNDIRDWKTSGRIARRMKELHQHVPLSKAERDGEPVCWKSVEQWLKIIQDQKFDISKPEIFRKVFHVETLGEFVAIVQKYKKWLSENDDCKLYLCHNDAQYGNLMFTSPLEVATAEPLSSTGDGSISDGSSSVSLFPQESNISVESILNVTSSDRINDNKLVVIDFEYSGANPASYDLANHLSEWMHDYNCATPHALKPLQYPTKDQVLNFLYSYCAGSSRGGTKRKNVESSFKDVFERDINEEVVALYNSIIRWRPMVQLNWAIWGVIQSGELETKSEKIVNGPDGEYIIGEYADEGEQQQQQHEKEGNQDIGVLVSSSDDDDDEARDGSGSKDKSSEEGTDIDSFNYLEYSKDKLDIFFSDLVGLGIIKGDSESKIILDTTYLSI